MIDNRMNDAIEELIEEANELYVDKPGESYAHHTITIDGIDYYKPLVKYLIRNASGRIAQLEGVLKQFMINDRYDKVSMECGECTEK